MTDSNWMPVPLLVLLLLGGCDSNRQGTDSTTKTSDVEIDRKTGEMWSSPGLPPPRFENLGVPSYRGLSDVNLWSEITRYEKAAIVSLKQPSLNRGYFRGKVLLSQEEVRNATTQVISIPGVHPYVSPSGISVICSDPPQSANVLDSQAGTQGLDHELCPPRMADGRNYPAIAVNVDSLETLSMLRSQPFVDFIEPLRTTIVLFSGGGCEWPSTSHDPDFSPFLREEFRYSDSFEIGDLAPWTFGPMGIRDSWRLFTEKSGVSAPGSGVTIAILDTGIVNTQPQLNGLFSSGFPGRSIVHLDPAQADSCSHGTRVAGLAAAPADGTFPKNIVGAAWGSTLVTAKVGNQPAILDIPFHIGGGGVPDPNSSEVVGVLAASDTPFNISSRLRTVVEDHHAKVVAMAFGLALGSDIVADNIRDLFDKYPMTIFVAAAGTGIPKLFDVFNPSPYVSYVAFPASMDREVLAVSMVGIDTTDNTTFAMAKPSSDWDGGHATYGKAVDFVAVNDYRNLVPTTGRTQDEIVSLSGSSSAVPQIAGTIALTWSRFDLSRAELISHLRRSSSTDNINIYERDRNTFLQVGSGVPDAYVAAGGSRYAAITGPKIVIPGQPYELRVTPQGAGNYSFLWNTGETTQVIQARGESEGSKSHSVTVRNLIDGSEVTATHVVFFSGVHRRMLYSEEMIVEFATFLDGKRVDRIINKNTRLPEGCSIETVKAQEYRKDGSKVIPQGTELTFLDAGNRGFSMNVSSGTSTDRLDVNFHVWHDGFSAIRVRATYHVWEPDGTDCNIPGVTRDLA